MWTGGSCALSSRENGPRLQRGFRWDEKGGLPGEVALHTAKELQSAGGSGSRCTNRSIPPMASRWWTRLMAMQHVPSAYSRDCRQF